MLRTYVVIAVLAVFFQRGGHGRKKIRGDKPFGSMIWADFREHGVRGNQLDGVVQVFGHTQVNEPVNFRNRFYCMDFRRAYVLDKATGEIYDTLTQERVKEIE